MHSMNFASKVSDIRQLVADAIEATEHGQIMQTSAFLRFVEVWIV